MITSLCEDHIDCSMANFISLSWRIAFSYFGTKSYKVLKLYGVIYLIAGSCIGL